MKSLSPKEIQSVLRLDGAARYRHFIKRVVDVEEAWGLWDGGWTLMASDDGALVFPLWPAREYAELNRIGDWEKCEPRPIALSELVGELLPSFRERGVLPGVFPTPEGKGVTLSADELSMSLRDADAEDYG